MVKTLWDLHVGLFLPLASLSSAFQISSFKYTNMFPVPVHGKTEICVPRLSPTLNLNTINGVAGSHFVLFVFILRRASLLGNACRSCCHLCLLSSLLHLQPLLLFKLRLLLPRLQGRHIPSPLLDRMCHFRFTHSNLRA